MLEGPLMADISGWIGAQPYGAQLQQFRDLMQRKGETVIQAFNAKCTEAGITPESWIKMGHTPAVILDEEVRAELVVLGQQGEHAEWIGEFMGSTGERVVRHSVKPCLITSDTFRPINRILAGYDGSGHASQALHEAVELAMALKVELVVITAAESEQEDRAQQISRDAADLVKAHDYSALTMVVKGQPADALIEHARDENCGLIVVGAYGHTRIREMIIGSTTTQIIHKSHLPVMLVR